MSLYTATTVVALTGDVTTTGSPGSLSATIAAIQGTTVTGTTGSGNVVLSANATLSGSVTSGGTFLISNGLVGTPSLAFANDTDTGFFLAAANECRLSNGGTATQIWQSAATFIRVPLGFSNGTAAAPGLSFESDLDTGIYRLSENIFGFSNGGTQTLQLSTTALTVMPNVVFLNTDGTVSLPAYSFASDPDTGLFRSGANEVRLSNGGTATQIWQSSGIFARFPFGVANGTVSAPSLTFENDTNTGIYSIGADNIGIAANGAKVLDIATTGLGVTGNTSSTNFIAGYTTTATAAGTTVLTVTSTNQQYFTGTTTQTITLPVTSTLTLGHTYVIVNNSTGNVTVNSSGANLIQTMTSNTRLTVTCILTSGTTAASWDSEYVIQAPVATEVAFSSNITTTSTTDVVLTGMTITPISGTYLVMFSTWLTASAASNVHTMSIYVNGVQNAGSIRAAIPFSSASLAATQDIPLSTNAIVTVNGSQAIDIRWRTSAGTATAHNGTLDILKVG